MHSAAHLCRDDPEERVRRAKHMDGRGDSPYVTHFHFPSHSSFLLGETPDALHGTPVLLNLLGTIETGAFFFLIDTAT